MKKASALLLMTAAMSLAASSAMAAPNTKEVKENGKVVRVDVAERPSNGTPEAQEGTKLVIDDPNAVVIAANPTKPTSIRVGIRANNATTNPISYVSVVPWYDYNIDVLPNEWIGGWPMESLKAGAMAVKMYAWYHIKYPKYSNCDVDNSVNSQIYKPNSRYSRTTSAVDVMSGIGLLKAGVLFETQYRAGSYDSSIPGTNIMSQNGTHYWADQGKTWNWMTNYYYPNSTVFYY